MIAYMVMKIVEAPHIECLGVVPVFRSESEAEVFANDGEFEIVPINIPSVQEGEA